MVRLKPDTTSVLMVRVKPDTTVVPVASGFSRTGRCLERNRQSRRVWFVAADEETVNEFAVA